ncbi:MAG: Uma2 family endonuclease [Luteitalea sp.]|nr:Uma2 family endonuclease [Luteitalea sp.]
MAVGISPQLVTADEMLRMPPDDGFRYELIRGAVVKMTQPGFSHGVYAARLLAALLTFVEARGLGFVTQEVGFKLESDPDTVRAPDVSFVSRERIGSTTLPRGYIQGAPDLAIEVLSPNDRPGHVRRKVHDWLAHGARAVWVVDPARRTLTVYTPDGHARVLSADQTLEGGDLLAGFQYELARLFTDL